MAKANRLRALSVALTATGVLAAACTAGSPGPGPTEGVPSRSPGPGDIRWNELGHNSFDPTYRSPFGAISSGTSVTVHFRTAARNVDRVDVVEYLLDPVTGKTTPSTQPMAYEQELSADGTAYVMWRAQLATTRPGLLYYKFRVTAGDDVDWYSDEYADDHDNLGQGGWGAASDDEPDHAFQLTVYDPAFATPEWLRNATVYQIFPDRFRNGDPKNDYCVTGSTTGCPVFYGTQRPIVRTPWNSAIADPRVEGQYKNQFGTQFYGGDLDGITAKLDYLKGLGVDTLYLTPIFTASSNHRYDTDDYLQIDPALGGRPAFDRLVAALKQRKMHLILDGVFNHVSSDSTYFDRYRRWPTVGGCESTTSSFRSWFDWKNDVVPCNGTSYDGWFGYDSLALLKDDSPGVRDFIYRSPTSVMNTWSVAGASGWRFDVATDLTHDWWHDLRPYAKKAAPDGPLVGEVWEDASSYLLGDQLDSVMNYRFRKSVLGFARGAGVGWKDNDNNGSNELPGLSPSQLDHALTAIREDYPPAAGQGMLNLVDSHDTNRAMFVLTETGDTGLTQATARLRLAALLQFTSVGAPMVYYGDEAGINAPSKANGTNGPEDDPYNRAPYPWPDAAGDQSIYGPVDAQLVSYYARLGALRSAHPALRTGDVSTVLTGDTTLSGTDDGTYAFARSTSQETVVVAVNNSASTNTAVLKAPSAWPDGTAVRDAFTGASVAVTGGAITVQIPARGGLVLVAG